MFVPCRIRSEDCPVLTFICTLLLGTYSFTHVSLYEEKPLKEIPSMEELDDDAFHTRWQD